MIWLAPLAILTLHHIKVFKQQSLQVQRNPRIALVSLTSRLFKDWKATLSDLRTSKLGTYLNDLGVQPAIWTLSYSRSSWHLNSGKPSSSCHSVTPTWTRLVLSWQGTADRWFSIFKDYLFSCKTKIRGPSQLRSSQNLSDGDLIMSILSSMMCKNWTGCFSI